MLLREPFLLARDGKANAEVLTDLCPICRSTFSREDANADLNRPIYFDCLSRVRKRPSCGLCRHIAQRVGEQKSCRCSPLDDTCIRVFPVQNHEHNRVWNIFYHGILKATLFRNNYSWGSAMTERDDTIANRDTIRAWLLNCRKKHLECESTGDTWYDSQAHSVSLIPDLNFIDTYNYCIVEGNLDLEYTALSYVWGDATQVCALEKNIKDLRTHGALQAPQYIPPRLVRDAIELCSSIGIRYLWVDALCIVQDSPSKHHTISRMDKIYSFANLAIIAVECRSADDSLPGVHRLSRSQLRPKFIRINEGFHSVPCCTDTNFNEHFTDSKYDTRAWTFQEALFSPRCLYITNTQVYFRCQEGLWAEDQPSKSIGSDADPYGLIRNTLKATSGEEAFRESVTRYTTRSLTYSTDILNAFSGIMDYLSHEKGWQFVDGMPLHNFPYQILFVLFGDSKRRLGSDGEPWLPSWSWAGWEGQSRWAAAFSEKEDGVPIKEPGRMIWGLLAKSVHGFSIGTCAMLNLVYHVSASTSLQLSAHTSRQNDLGPDVPKMFGRICQSTTPYSWITFRARIIPANVLSTEPIWYEDYLDYAYHICCGEKRVGVLLNASSENIEQYWFVQIFTNGALLVGPSTTNNDSMERVGVAFFHNGADVFNKWPMMEIRLT